MTIGDELWEHMKIATEQAIKQTGEPAVRLRGGPCDGWLVGDEAAMLTQAHWYDQIPHGEKWRAEPGAYQLVDGVMDRDARIAEWIERGQDWTGGFDEWQGVIVLEVQIAMRSMSGRAKLVDPAQGEFVAGAVKSKLAEMSAGEEDIRTGQVALVGHREEQWTEW